MIDKVIKLKNDLQYYVIDEYAEGLKNYLFCMQVDNDNSQISDRYLVCYYESSNLGDMVIHDIEDEKEYAKVVDKFLSRIE